MDKLQLYNDFLLSKMCIAPESGLSDFEIPYHTFLDGTELKPHQRDAITWAIRGGRRALFESFGLGKTIQQLIICKTIIEKEGGLGLIICPLGVRQEFVRDARVKLGTNITYIRNKSELIEGIKNGENLFITNYERVRDGDLNPTSFTVTSLDEASVLRSYRSKTYQTFLDKFKGIKYKFVATATPSPNKYKELIHYAGYLEIMDTGQALTRFFKRDSTQANNLTVYPHKEKEFWLWMSTWALFITKPSDLGYNDTGYDLPPSQIIYHEVAVDHRTAISDQDGQGKLFRDAALGLKDAAREKRKSLGSRIAKMEEIIKSDPESHYIIWHDLEAERYAVEKALPKSKSVYGSQDLDIREQTIIDFSEGKIQYLATKPEISGQGCNFQYHCHKAIFLGIGYEFNSFIQAIHRIYRFQQSHPVEIHIIYAESEREILKTLLKKWKQHDHLVEQMTAIIKEHGLSNTNTMEKLKRSIITERSEQKGNLYTAVYGDCVPETMRMNDNSMDLIVTSIPFANHYEYTPTYNDFGHTESNDHFWQQMDFLTPELFRALRPGRIACIHIKDRILFGNATGDGFPQLDGMIEETLMHFKKHGFRKLAVITIETDVVRENNQTYRLGWTEKTKDGTKMGVGCPEYLLVFRKLPSDTSKAYADIPVVKTKEQYPRGHWQIDARAKWNSSGDRFLSPDELRQLPIDKLNRYFYEFMKDRTYDYDLHVNTAIELDKLGKLPSDFQTLDIPARTFFVWDDINRMLTLNGSQSRKKLQMHICPLQFDIVDRCIELFSNENETVYDPFGGLFTVPYRAIKLNRKGYAVELNPESYKDGMSYLRAAEMERLSPSLFELIEKEIA